MNNTLENKSKFGALYLYQKVFWHPEYKKETAKLEPIRLDITYKYLEEGYCLLLKDIRSINDKDAVKLGYGNSQHLRSNILYNKDELRQLGYALDWCGLSVEKQVEYGWVKLK